MVQSKESMAMEESSTFSQNATLLSTGKSVATCYCARQILLYLSLTQVTRVASVSRNSTNMC